MASWSQLGSSSQLHMQYRIRYDLNKDKYKILNKTNKNKNKTKQTNKETKNKHNRKKKLELHSSIYKRGMEELNEEEEEM